MRSYYLRAGEAAASSRALTNTSPSLHWILGARFIRTCIVLEISGYISNYEYCRQSFSQTRTVLCRALLCVNQWEEEKYFTLFR
jgi:hypothetical protein